MRKLLSDCSRNCIKTRLVLLDREFFSTAVIHEIKQNHDTFIMPATLFPNSTLNIHSQDKSQTNYDSSPVPVQHQSSNCKSSP